MPKSRRMKTMRRKRSTRRRTTHKRMRHRTVGAGCSWYDRKCKERERNIQREIYDLNSKLRLDKEFLGLQFDENSQYPRHLLLKRQYNDALRRDERRYELQRMGHKISNAKSGTTVPLTLKEEEQQARYEAYYNSEQNRRI